MSGEATARPWAIDSDLQPNGRTVFARVHDGTRMGLGYPISGNDEGRRGLPSPAEGRANAELIVKAVNSYDEREALLAEAEEALRSAAGWLDVTETLVRKPERAAVNAECRKARAVLAKIESRK